MRLMTKAAIKTVDVVKNPSVWLWTVQVLVAALFLMAGGVKLVMSAEQLQQGPIALPVPFVRFIGVAEVVGAFGLLLPGIFRIKTILTPVAALGLISIMGGAVTISFIEGGAAMASFPFVVGLLLTFIAYGRFRLAPQQARRATRLVLQPAA
jgi:DoxX-like family